MSRKWEMKEVSTPEQIFDKVKTEMERPVGIVIFGADDSFSNEVLSDVMGILQGNARYYAKKVDASALTQAFKIHSTVVALLDPKISSNKSKRREFVQLMQTSGARTLIGIHAKVRKMPMMHLEYGAEAAEMNHRISTIKRSDPASDGYDYFIRVSSKKGGVVWNL